MIKQQKSFEIDPRHFGLLALQSAGTVLYTCQTRCPAVGSGSDYEKGYDPIVIVLQEHVNLSPHDYTLMLQSMVELLYDVQTLDIEDRYTFLLFGRRGSRQRQLIANALSAYQEWKTAHIAAEKARLGPGYEHFGDDTDFNRRDWTDQNDAFLSV